MARSQAQVYDELALLAHPVFTDTAPGRAILNGLALLLSQAELAWDDPAGWFEQLRRVTASDEWLDMHGEMHGQERDGGESDDLYRPRAIFAPRGLTVDEAQKLADRQLARQGEGYNAVLVEPYQSVLDDGAFLDTAYAMVTEPLGTPGRPRYLAWMHLPVPEANQPFDDGAWLDDTAFLDERCYIGEDITSLVRPYILRTLELLDERRIQGVGLGVSVRDFMQPAFYETITPPTP